MAVGLSSHRGRQVKAAAIGVGDGGGAAPGGVDAEPPGWSGRWLWLAGSGLPRGHVDGAAAPVLPHTLADTVGLSGGVCHSRRQPTTRTRCCATRETCRQPTPQPTRPRERTGALIRPHHGTIPPPRTRYGDLDPVIVMPIDASLVRSQSTNQHPAPKFKRGYGFHLPPRQRRVEHRSRSRSSMPTTMRPPGRGCRRTDRTASSPQRMKPPPVRFVQRREGS